MANSSNRHNLPQGLVMGDEVIIEPSWSEIDDSEVEDEGDEPTLADVMHEIKALREVCARHAELLLALTNGGFPVIHKDMLAFIHEGNAVVPTAWADLSERSGKTPEASPGRTASGPGEA